MRKIADQLTKSLPGLEAGSARAECLFETFVGTIRDGRVDNQDQTGLQSSPKTADTIWALDNFLGSSKQSSAVDFAGGLLSGGHNGDGDCEELGQSARKGAKRQLSGGRVGGSALAVGGIDGADNGIPIKVGKVGGGDTE